MATTTIDTETELSAVNAILGAIGQSPVTSITGNTNPEIDFIYNLLKDANVDVQAEGWHFNTEKHVTYTPNSDDKIVVGADVLQMDVTNGWGKKQHDVVKRNGFLYDKYDHTDIWDGDMLLDITKLITFVEVPEVFKRYIVAKASTRAATQLVGNPQLAKLLATQEALSRATCIEYDCTQGNHSMLNLPEDSIYTTYQPWRTLVR